MARVELSPPHVSEVDREALLAAFDSGWLAPTGPALDAFELEFAARVGVDHAVALTSGTAALHLALLLLGVGRGDEVLVSDLTFAAPANVVCYVGAAPTFIDCDEASWNVDPVLLSEELMERAQTGHLPKAVIVVDLYGQVADFDPIRGSCEEYGVAVVEDAAEALGASYQGLAAGSLGDLGVFSFNGNKVITTSGGGMLVTGRGDWAERARYLATQAREPVRHYEHTEIGYNYRLSNVLASLGRSQLGQLDERVARRQAINRSYREALADLPGVDFMPDAGSGTPSWWLTCLTVDPTVCGVGRDDLIQLLARHDVEARPTCKPLHLQPVFQDAPVRGGKISERIFEHGLCLPSGSSMTDDQLADILGLIRSAFR
jgi:dTDP-4-amino-4,6-dideoxygalactose transaminase